MAVIYLIDKQRREYAFQALRKAPELCVVSITKPQRTIPQRNLMWVLLYDVSKACPQGRAMTPDMWKAVLMKACGHAVQFINGIDGEPFPIGFRSSHLNKEQTSDLLTYIYWYGDQHGVPWSEAKRSGFMTGSIEEKFRRTLH